MISARKFFLKHFDGGKNTIPEVMRLYARGVAKERDIQLVDHFHDMMEGKASKGLPELSELK